MDAATLAALKYHVMNATIILTTLSGAYQALLGLWAAPDAE